MPQKIHSQWEGKKVAFLGDSVTDKCHVGTTKNYWRFLAENLGIEPLVYGLNGWQWSGMPGQAEKLFAEHGENVDAVCIFAGTNDFNSDVPLGEWFTFSEETVNRNGRTVALKCRRPAEDPQTLRGRINLTMKYLKERFPRTQIILLTPLHRGFARFSADNIQPDETYANPRGLFIDDYVAVIKEAGNVWAVPVIDLNSLSGLYPLAAGHARYFHDAATDLLHPNAAGHARLAATLQYQLLALPAGF